MTGDDEALVDILLGDDGSGWSASVECTDRSSVRFGATDDHHR